MTIRCYKCGKHLGEIRDATLRKNIYHICYECASTKKAPDLFDTLFGMKK